ncbi:hypothetical protein TWF506_002227 [Arthrobotrys conoides]|uniref:Uncharacterized protein n=1 Tax=Arthrobotrys conoides TaxID=74498 RepID=A0AAN8RL70_9PEZI
MFIDMLIYIYNYHINCLANIIEYHIISYQRRPDSTTLRSTISRSLKELSAWDPSFEAFSSSVYHWILLALLARLSYAKRSISTLLLLLLHTRTSLENRSP